MDTKADIIATPSKYYRTPNDLVRTVDLSTEEKIMALISWIDEEKQLAEATNENMPGIGDEDNIVDNTLADLTRLLAQLTGR